MSRKNFEKPTMVLKFINFASAFFSVFSFALVVGRYESSSETVEELAGLFDSNTFAAIITICNAIGVALLIAYQMLVSSIYKKRKISLFFHIFLLLVTPFGPLHTSFCIKPHECYSTIDIIIFFQLCRIFPLLLATLPLTSYYNSYDPGKFPLSSPSYFAIKCLQTYHKALFYLFLYLFGMFFTAYALKITERRNMAFDGYECYFNCLWNAMITGDNIGYGDMIPKTLLGRIVASIWAVYGYITIWLFLVFASNFFTLTHKEFLVYRDINLITKASKLIAKFLSRKNFSKELKDFTQERKKCYKGQFDFGALLVKFTDRAPLDLRGVDRKVDLLSKNLDEILSNLDGIEKLCERVKCK